jgi:hypothetical protein
LKNLESFSSAKKRQRLPHLLSILGITAADMEEAIAIADELLKDKQLIVFTKKQ